MLCSAMPIKKNGPANAAMAAAHTEHIKLAKGNKGHGLGDGSTFRMGALLINLSQTVEDGNLKKYLMEAVAKFDPKSKITLRAVKLCKTEVMHSSDVLRFKLSIPSDVHLENSIIDALTLSEKGIQWIGPRPSGYLEPAAQTILADPSKLA